MIVHKSHILARIMMRLPRWFGRIEPARLGLSMDYRRISLRR